VKKPFRFDPGYRWGLVRDGKLLKSGFLRNTVTSQGLEKFAYSLIGDWDYDGVCGVAPSYSAETGIPCYLGLINEASFTGISIGDTMASHSGWTEWTSYRFTSSIASNSTDRRPLLAYAQPSAGHALFNNELALASVYITANGNIRGFFASSGQVKGTSTGYLVSAGAFTGGAVAVSSGDTFLLEYRWTNYT
jgi:hypothetical protein